MPRTHVGKKGECLASIAAKYGFSSWREIYDDPSNTALRSERPNANVLAPGDRLVIPDRKPVKRRLKSGTAHTIVVPRDTVSVRIKIGDTGTFRYELRVGALVREGEVQGPGLIEQDVDPKATRGELRVWPTEFDSFEAAGTQATLWALTLGGLDPAGTVTGLQARLKNLGYFEGDVDGRDDERLVEAVRTFQEDIEDLEPTGHRDQQTLKALVDRHGC